MLLDSRKGPKNNSNVVWGGLPLRRQGPDPAVQGVFVVAAEVVDGVVVVAGVAEVVVGLEVREGVGI